MIFDKHFKTPMKNFLINLLQPIIEEQLSQTNKIKQLQQKNIKLEKKKKNANNKNKKMGNRIDQLERENKNLKKKIKRLEKKNNELQEKIRPNKKPVSKRIKEKVFMRDNYTCLCCGNKKDLTIDHIVPRVLGGSNDVNNLQTLCYNCNIRKGELYMDYRDTTNLINNVKVEI